MITGKLYDRLKFLAQILLPALGSLYFGLAGIWGLPSAEEVVGTIVLIDTFLGVLLGISQTAFNKNLDGVINVIETPTDKKFDLVLNSDPYELEDKKKVQFKVNKLDGESGLTLVEALLLLALVLLVAVIAAPGIFR